MLTAALFIRAKTWKPAKCPSTDEWIKKMWDIEMVNMHNVHALYTHLYMYI